MLRTRDKDPKLLPIGIRLRTTRESVVDSKMRGKMKNSQRMRTDANKKKEKRKVIKIQLDKSGKSSTTRTLMQDQQLECPAPMIQTIEEEGTQVSRLLVSRSLREIEVILLLRKKTKGIERSSE